MVSDVHQQTFDEESDDRDISRDAKIGPSSIKSAHHADANSTNTVKQADVSTLSARGRDCVVPLRGKLTHVSALDTSNLVAANSAVQARASANGRDAPYTDACVSTHELLTQSVVSCYECARLVITGNADYPDADKRTQNSHALLGSKLKASSSQSACGRSHVLCLQRVQRVFAALHVSLPSHAVGSQHFRCQYTSPTP